MGVQLDWDPSMFLVVKDNKADKIKTINLRSNTKNDLYFKAGTLEFISNAI